MIDLAVNAPLRAQFGQVYRHTISRLQADSVTSLTEEFLRQDLDWHYFAPFLKVKQVETSTFELAQIEWIYYESGREQLGSVTRVKATSELIYSNFGFTVKVNPLARWIFVSQDIPEMQMGSGLWLFTAKEFNQGVEVFQLKKVHALLIDLLSEGLTFSRDQLLKTAELASGLDCTEAFAELLERDVIQLQRV